MCEKLISHMIVIFSHDQCCGSLLIFYRSGSRLGIWIRIWILVNTVLWQTKIHLCMPVSLRIEFEDRFIGYNWQWPPVVLYKKSKILCIIPINCAKQPGQNTVLWIRFRIPNTNLNLKGQLNTDPQHWSW